MFDLETKLCQIFNRNSNVRMKFDFMVLYRSSGIRFQMGLGISIPCRFLGGVSGNQDLLKGTWWFLRVQPPSRGIAKVELKIMKLSKEYS